MVSIEVLGLTILEPSNLLTNLVISVACWVWAHRLRRGGAAEVSLQQGWRLFFALMGVSTLLGGMAHGFDLYFGKGLHVLAWSMSGLAVLYAETATVLAVRPRRLRLWLQGFSLVKYLAFLLLVWHTEDFFYVKMNSSLGLLGLVSITKLYLFVRWRMEGAGAVVLGIALLLLPAALHATRFSLDDEWFTYNDISHLLIVLAFGVVYSGTLKLDLAALRLRRPRGTVRQESGQQAGE